MPLFFCVDEAFVVFLQFNLMTVEMMLPQEIIENILAKCDGKTLLTARKVSDDWKNIIDYLTKKTRIWEWCCKEEIPCNELSDYLLKYDERDVEKWLSIYINWSSWENIQNVMCDIVLCPVEFDMPRISCLAVSNNHIALGSEDGRLRIYNRNWDMLFVSRIAAVRITSVTFIEFSKDFDVQTIFVAVSYAKGLYILHFDGIFRNQMEILDVKSHSIYKNYICYEKLGGRLTICKLIEDSGRTTLQEIWFTRIYSPSCITTFKMWNDICTVLINGHVKVLNYNRHITPMKNMRDRTYVKFNFPLFVDSTNTQILRDDVIISLYRYNEEVKNDFIEFIILENKKKYSKKLFNAWEILECHITCLHVYGNTLIIGVDIGNVYLYHVSSWKNLDLRNYDHKFIIGRHPIIDVGVKEVRGERKFFIASTFNVHVLSGFVPNSFV